MEMGLSIEHPLSDAAIWALLNEKLNDHISFDEFCDRLRAISGWRPVDGLMTEMKPGDQWDVLFGRPTWSWPILGMVTHMSDHLAWSAYDQQNDKFIEWDSEEPTVYVVRPGLPSPEMEA